MKKTEEKPKNLPLLLIAFYLKDLKAFAMTSPYAYAVSFFALFHRQGFYAESQQKIRLMMALKSGNITILRESTYLRPIKDRLSSISLNPQCDPTLKALCFRAHTILTDGDETTLVRQQWVRFTYTYYHYPKNVTHLQELLLSDEKRSINRSLIMRVPKKQLNDILQNWHRLFFFDDTHFKALKAIISYRRFDCEEKSLHSLAEKLVFSYRRISSKIAPYICHSSLRWTLLALAALMRALTDETLIKKIRQECIYFFKHPSSCHTSRIAAVILASTFSSEEPQNQTLIQLAAEAANQNLMQLTRCQLSYSDVVLFINFLAKHNQEGLIRLAQTLRQQETGPRARFHQSGLSSIDYALAYANSTSHSKVIKVIEECGLTVTKCLSYDQTNSLSNELQDTILSFMASQPLLFKQIIGAIQSRQVKDPYCFVGTLARIPSHFLQQEMLFEAAKAYLERYFQLNRNYKASVMAMYVSKITDADQQNYFYTQLKPAWTSNRHHLSIPLTLALLPHSLLSPSDLLQILKAINFDTCHFNTGHFNTGHFNTVRMQLEIIPAIVSQVQYESTSPNDAKERTTILNEIMVRLSKQTYHAGHSPQAWQTAMISLAPFTATLSHLQFAEIHAALFKTDTQQSKLVLALYWSASSQKLLAEHSAATQIQGIARGGLTRKKRNTEHDSQERNEQAQLNALLEYLATPDHWVRNLNIEYPRGLPYKTFKQLSNDIETIQLERSNLEITFNDAAAINHPKNTHHTRKSIHTALVRLWGGSTGFALGLFASVAIIASVAVFAGALPLLPVVTYIFIGIATLVLSIGLGISLSASIKSTQRSKPLLRFFDEHNVFNLASTKTNMNHFLRRNREIDQHTKILPAIHYPGMVPDFKA